MCKLDGIDFNLAAIPGDFNVPRREEFDRNYMSQLFTLGYDLGKRGYPWKKYPPGLQRVMRTEKAGIPYQKTSLP